MNEHNEKDQLIDEFPELYLHVRMEERAPRSKRLKVRGVIEICPDENECESNWNMISVTGKNRYYYARKICREITQARKKHKEIEHIRPISDHRLGGPCSHADDR